MKTGFSPDAPATLDPGPAGWRRRAWNHPAVRRWGPLLGKFVAVQLVVQAMGFVAGLWVIRALSARDYAYYTLANTMLGTLNLLADGGIGTGLLSLAGRVHEDRRDFGRLIVTTLGLRRWFVGALAFGVLPALAYLLRHNGAGWTETAMLCAMVLVGSACHLNVDVLSVVPRYRGQVSRLQKLDLLGGGMRLGGLAALAWAPLGAVLALSIPTVTALAQATLARRYAADTVDLRGAPDPAYRRHILGTVRSMAAGVVFYCFQGQITVWVIGLFGNPTAVAEVGALGRLAVIFALVGTVQNNLLMPRFASCHDPARLRRQYFGIGGVSAALGGVLLAVAWALPQPFLLLLGPKYLHLQRELPLIVGGTVLHFIASTLWLMNTSRAWIVGSWLNIPLTLGAQVLCLPFVDLSTVHGVLLFSLAPGFPAVGLNLWLGLRGLRAVPANPSVHG